jgi:hypothetical protein
MAQIFCVNELFSQLNVNFEIMHTKLLSVFFSAILLLSSGAMQLGVHLCSKTGPTFFSSCETDHNEPPCCKKNKTHKAENSDCCKETYWFAITPKFGSIEKIQLPSPVALEIEGHTLPQSLLGSAICAEIRHAEHSPPGQIFNRTLQRFYCIWTI